MATNYNGLTYYKLDAELHGYPGDITKNCGLRGEEIDGNFNFLRGNDVEHISFDEQGTMYIKKYNGEVLSASQIEKPEKPEYDFTYNSEDGVLTIITPNGNEVKLEGFNIAIPTPSSVYHDSTLIGNGSKESILGVSNITKTGRYLPAIKLIDLSAQDENGNSIEQLPTENNALHDRYVTKEYISHFGRLYSLKGVQKISEKLKELNSEWHIPSKEEWDEILNTVDCYKPNHDEVESNIELGESAGSILKGTKYWKANENGEVLSQDNFNFNILPVGYCGNRGKNFYGSFGESAAFWTSTLEAKHNDMYIKCFNYDKETVGQHTWGENFYLSIRLVKKFDGNNYNSSEIINGVTSNCVHIPGTNTVWTSENIAFTDKEFDSFLPEEWKDIMESKQYTNNNPYRFFVNDWNGETWDKHEIKDGESIVIQDNENGGMHEWMIVNGELIDTIGMVLNHTNEILEDINNRLNLESETREIEDIKLFNEIANERNKRIENVNALTESIKEEVKNRIDAINNLSEQLTQESSVRNQDIISLRNDLNTEISSRIENVDNLTIKLSEESTERKESDIFLQGNIDTEKTERVNSDIQLQSNIDKEQLSREEADANETASRISADKLLQQLIDENKLIIENNSIVIIPGHTDESGNTTPTTIKVNLDPNCEYIKLGENGIYFDGNLGQF